MQDGVLRPLDVTHVITGMNVESIASILQKKTSHYDLDALTHILAAIGYVCLLCPYFFFLLFLMIGTL